jgi:hypothetical protein
MAQKAIFFMRKNTIQKAVLQDNPDLMTTKK